MYKIIKDFFNTFYSNELQKYKNNNIYKIHGSISHIYLEPLPYDLHNLQGQFMGFHGLILTLNVKRDSYSCIYCCNISEILGPKYEMSSMIITHCLIFRYLKKDLCLKLSL